MAFKQWIYLLIPLVLIILVFSLFAEGPKDPVEIFANAELKLSEKASYSVDSEMVIDMSLFGTVIRYVSNSTNAKLNGESYTRVITSMPFSSGTVTTEEFVLNEGNFTCTNSLSRPICYENPEIKNDLSTPLSVDDYNYIEYLGEKEINSVNCDAIFASVNSTSIGSILGDYANSFANVKNIFLYSCLDPETGFSLESLWGINGETNYNGLLIDMGVNVSKVFTSFSEEVPESLFELPYELVPQEVYNGLMLEALNATESQNL